MQSNVPSKLRTLNKSVVLNIIMKKGPISRAQISKEANITRASTSQIVQDLIDEGFIIETGIKKGNIGRKGLLLSFNNSYGFIVGVDLGGTKISIGIFDYNNDFKYSETINTFQVNDRELFIERLINLIEQVIANSGKNIANLKGIGIASPGIIDFNKGVIVEGSPNLPRWKNLFLKDIFECAFNVPVIIDNDVRAALIGEFYKGKCQGAQSAILVALGTGIGSAMLIDGKIIRGAGNAAGEIGYTLLERKHLYEDWGDKGCFETMASGSGLISKHSQWTNTKEIFVSAKEGNKEAQEIVKSFSDYLSMVLINIIALMNPEKVVLSGGLARSSNLYLADVVENLNMHSFTRNKVNLEVTDLYDKAALYGISVLALSTIHPEIEFLENVDILG